MYDELSIAGGIACPPLDELVMKKRCGETSCFTYYWKAREWNECRLNSLPPPPLVSGDATRSSGRGLGAECGAGVQTREVYCSESTGDKVNSRR